MRDYVIPLGLRRCYIDKCRPINVVGKNCSEMDKRSDKYRAPMLSDNAMTVLKRRYLVKDRQGRVVETPQQMFWRVAKAIAAADAAYGASEQEIQQTATRFYEAMAALQFMPNSPTLMNAGRPLGQLSACFVLPVGDSMEEIFGAIRDAALIHKSGGGTGFSFSRLRPRNSVVASTQGVASGPVSFMRVFNAATEAVKQGGTRRGANMGILRVDHPDIIDFIGCKDNPDELTNFNISVAITDEFMRALAADEEYALIDPRTNQGYEQDGAAVRLKATEVFDEIVDHAWRTGEPGLVFIDRMNQANPTYPYETIEATNPCGEQPLPAYDSCNLGSVNLACFVREPLPPDYTPSAPDAGVDWEQLAGAVSVGVHFLDNVIDQNRYPLERIKEQTRRNRRIGLGIMGWADMLVRLQLPYNDTAAFDLAERVMSFVQARARTESSELAKVRGKFPNWDKSVYAAESVMMRNATTTSIAPTGTISIIAGCSSGIEPYYAVAFQRRVLDGTILTEVNPLFEQVARQTGFYSEALRQRLAGRRSLAEIKEIPEEVRALFLTSADISPSDHIRMQTAFQKFTDTSVSKTINFRTEASRRDVAEAFQMAYRLGCKGITIYRDGSRPQQVLSPQDSASGTTEPRAVRQRPPSLPGVTEKIKTGQGNLYVTVNFRDGVPFEVFAQIGHSGYSTLADTEAICRLVSLALRSGVPVDQVVRQLRGIGGGSTVFFEGAKITSIPDAVAQVLARQAGLGDDPDNAELEATEPCPECGSPLQQAASCLTCASCGYSTC